MSATMGRNVYYLTSSIPYANAEPHVGTAYEIVACDFIARYRRLRGDQVFFLTGLDEHSQNIARSAAELGITPQEWTDRMAPKWLEVWERLDSSPTTTSSGPPSLGMPSVSRRSCSASTTGGRSTSAPTGARTASPARSSNRRRSSSTVAAPSTARRSRSSRRTTISSRSRSTRSLCLDLYDRHPEFVEPAFRRNEVVSFVKGGLQDLSISRSGTDWGIPLPVGSGARDLRLGRRAAELRDGRRASGPTRSCSSACGRPTCTSSARTSCGSTR